MHREKKDMAVTTFIFSEMSYLIEKNKLIEF